MAKMRVLHIWLYRRPIPLLLPIPWLKITVKICACLKQFVTPGANESLQ